MPNKYAEIIQAANAEAQSDEVYGELAGEPTLTVSGATWFLVSCTMAPGEVFNVWIRFYDGPPSGFVVSGGWPEVEVSTVLIESMG